MHLDVYELLYLLLFPLIIEASDVQVDHFYIDFVVDNMPHFSDLRYFGGFLCLSHVVDFFLPFSEYLIGRYFIDYESWNPEGNFIFPSYLEVDSFICCFSWLNLIICISI